MGYILWDILCWISIFNTGWDNGMPHHIFNLLPILTLIQSQGWYILWILIIKIYFIHTIETCLSDYLTSLPLSSLNALILTRIVTYRHQPRLSMVSELINGLKLCRCRSMHMEFCIVIIVIKGASRKQRKQQFTEVAASLEPNSTTLQRVYLVWSYWTCSCVKNVEVVTDYDGLVPLSFRAPTIALRAQTTKQIETDSLWRHGIAKVVCLVWSYWMCSCGKNKNIKVIIDNDGLVPLSVRAPTIILRAQTSKQI